MPPKRTQKKGATAKAKAAGAAAAAASKTPPATTMEPEAALPVKPSTRVQPLPEAGSKRAEPEPPTVDLQATLQRRQKLAEELQTVEKQIYDLETRYLENSHPLGNALKGYEGLLSQSQASTRRTLVRQEDRLFSNSSVSGAPH